MRNVHAAFSHGPEPHNGAGALRWEHQRAACSFPLRAQRGGSRLSVTRESASLQNSEGKKKSTPLGHSAEDVLL